MVSAFARALWASLVAGAGVFFILAPWMPAVCPMRLVLHAPCPSCGLTRAFRAVLQGDLATATRMHPLWWAVAAYLGAVVSLEVVSYVRTGTLGARALSPVVQRAGLALLVALVLVWVARFAGAMGGPAPV
jgi:hypothetical protein